MFVILYLFKICPVDDLIKVTVQFLWRQLKRSVNYKECNYFEIQHISLSARCLREHLEQININ